MEPRNGGDMIMKNKIIITPFFLCFFIFGCEEASRKTERTVEQEQAAVLTEDEFISKATEISKEFSEDLEQEVYIPPFDIFSGAFNHSSNYKVFPNGVDTVRIANLRDFTYWLKDQKYGEKTKKEIADVCVGVLSIYPEMKELLRPSLEFSWVGENLQIQVLGSTTVSSFRIVSGSTCYIAGAGLQAIHRESLFAERPNIQWVLNEYDPLVAEILREYFSNFSNVTIAEGSCEDIATQVKSVDFVEVALLQEAGLEVLAETFENAKSVLNSEGKIVLYHPATPMLQGEPSSGELLKKVDGYKSIYRSDVSVVVRRYGDEESYRNMSVAEIEAAMRSEKVSATMSLIVLEKEVK